MPSPTDTPAFHHPRCRPEIDYTELPFPVVECAGGVEKLLLAMSVSPGPQTSRRSGNAMETTAAASHFVI